ncbi:MAG TPA: hypothetical protein VG013_38855 [Gemmataceae bacterium]|nr:hypothetical protein [Gemmataceae bacterium]
MIEPFKPDNGNYWVIALNPQAIGTGGSGDARGRSTERLRRTFDRCWTGHEWAPQMLFAMRFDSRLAAQEYLAEHRRLMEAALEGTIE